MNKILLLAGIFTNWKGHKLALQAIARLKVDRFKLVFIGDLQGRVKYKN